MSNQSSITQDVGLALAKAFPPVTIYALTLNEWLAAVSIVYVLLQTAYLIVKWVGEGRRRRAAVARTPQDE